MRLLIHFARYGPYHQARLQSAKEALGPMGWEVMGLEIAGTDATYAWEESGETGGAGPGVVTAFPGRVYEQIKPKELRRGLFSLLDRLAADAVAIAGWGSVDARTCLAWCRRNGVPAIVMSETRAADGRRVWWKERLKRTLIARYDGALVGGRSHRKYLGSLGMDAGRVHTGYNVVDNAYFDSESSRHRIQEPACCSPYFLSSNRFIERKNLAMLVEAYSGYVERIQAFPQQCRSVELGETVGAESLVSATWPLVLLGDGELKAALVAQCQTLGLTVVESAPWETDRMPGYHAPGSDVLARAAQSRPQTSGTVYFPGFRQIEELPRFYAHAGCFVHPALEEPWGLVINEAMACGLPILSSRNVGAAEELVVDGDNGWGFNPLDVNEIRDCLLRVGAEDFPLVAFGAASRRLLEERAPLAAFGEGLRQALGSAVSTTVGT